MHGIFFKKREDNPVVQPKLLLGHVPILAEVWPPKHRERLR